MKEILDALDLTENNSGSFDGQWLSSPQAESFESVSPINSEVIARVLLSSKEDYEKVVSASTECFIDWRQVPAPKRGEIIRQIAEELRRLKEPLGQLVSLEMGKILAEGLGEIQEAIDIADFSVGLSRQLYGRTMHSERAQHRMYEQWHPLGPIGVISAFNFPAAVWAWNAYVAAVCGNTVIWKPSELTPLIAIALTKISASVASANGYPALFTLINSPGADLGSTMSKDSRLPLISATGSCRMGRIVGQEVAARFGKSLLELGGNNALIVLEDADLELALRAIVFGSVGTAGQRCTTTRRLLVHKKIRPKLVNRLIEAYEQISIGDPLEPGTLMGPLIHSQAVLAFQNAVEEAKKQGGKVITGGSLVANAPSELFVQPTIILATPDMPIVKEETFAPILYVIDIENLEQGIEIQNDVPQGLSSAIFTGSIQKAELFLSHVGSDCGIANVNIGTSGAEIGGAFGGEKETGGGREAGSDSWKAYMRRQTNTINWGDELPLAQGITFE
jgi:aldehyde dehydrogenase (NAD+)